MSIVTTVSRKATTTRAASNVVAEANEFDGFWLNLGVQMATDGEAEGATTFVRLPRGVAVSDLKARKVYESTDPIYAAQTTLMNRVIALIQSKCAGMAEGESKPINLEVVLYRRQEESEVAAAPDETSDLEKALFS